MSELIRRTKLLHGITYFVTRTTHCGKAKLYWLLYLLDFRVYAATSLSVTGLDYYAGVDGPVPLTLDQEFDSPQYDLAQQFHVDNLVLNNGRRLLALYARGNYEAEVFTDYERETLHSLATVHANSDASAINEQMFLPTQPWRATYQAATREYEPIEYRLVNPDEFAVGTDLWHLQRTNELPAALR